MKQTVNIGDSLSRKLHDEVSADLKGYVNVQVKNKHTGEIEHQENHNLIVYGGREWLLKRIFGSTLPNNQYATNSGIRWVGFGCGGGEAGNPLQAGTTLGQDTDLYEPCRIRFEDDSVTSESSGMYASRILPTGAIVPGYFKKISNVTIKEDHANPYVENNIRKYPKLIAEVRVELSSDDCNGENYTENGNLVAYQDINEVGLFISDLTSADPGKNDEYDEIFLDVIAGDITQELVYTNKVYLPSGISSVLTKNTESDEWSVANITANSYVLQYRVNTVAGTEIQYGNWTNINGTIENYKYDFENNSVFKIIRNASNNLEYYVNNTKIEDPEGWGKTLPGASNMIDFRLLSIGKYTLQYKNGISNNTGNKNVYCELQYKNYSTDDWKTIDSHVFAGTDKTSVRTFNISCGDHTNPEIGIITNFRVRETLHTITDIAINAMEVDETSYDVKCYVSNEDIKKINVGDYVFTDQDTQAGNTISRACPLSVIEKYDPTIEDPDTQSSHTAYFVIERQATTNKTYAPALAGHCYVPSRSKTSPYTMFSRVTLSSIRKTVDREIILVWKIYC